MQLGHKSIRTTLTNYTDPNEEDKMRIDDILTPQKKVTVEEVVEQLTKHFVNGGLPEEEYLYAIKSLKKNRVHKNWIRMISPLCKEKEIAGVHTQVSGFT